MPDRACPSDAELAALAAGAVSTPGLEAPAAHLEACPACQGRLEHFDSRANSVAAVRAEGDDLPPTDPEQAVQPPLPAQRQVGVAAEGPGADQTDCLGRR